MTVEEGRTYIDNYCYRYLSGQQRDVHIVGEALVVHGVVRYRMR